MAGISLNAVEGIGDVLGNWRFLMEIAPNLAISQTNSVTLELYCQQVDFSGITVETMPISLHGHEIQFRGRQTFNKSISASFVETNGVLYSTLLTWKDSVVGLTSGNGAYRSGYSSTCNISILDVTGNIALSQTVFYMFITELSNIQLDGSSSGPALVQATFSYDFAIVAGVPYNQYGSQPTI